MYSKNFTDKYGTSITVRIGNGHTHVQLLMRFEGDSEPFSYGFDREDFKTFTNHLRSIEGAISRDKTHA